MTRPNQDPGCTTNSSFEEFWFCFAHHFCSENSRPFSPKKLRFAPTGNAVKNFPPVKRHSCTSAQNAIQAWKADTASAGGVSHRSHPTPCKKARRADRDSPSSHCYVGPSGLCVSFGYDRGLTAPAEAMSAHSGLNRNLRNAFAQCFDLSKLFTA